MRVIAIDGPAGSGKSTVAGRSPAGSDLDYLDTGAMYRGVTFAVLRRQMDPDEEEPVAAVARDLELDVVDTQVTVDGVDASLEIRGPEVTSAVSVVAANPGVRAELRRRQRSGPTSTAVASSKVGTSAASCSRTPSSRCT